MGLLASRTKKTEFSGQLASGWDGTIDYTFIDSYGHRGIYESYIRSPRWREDPTYLLESLTGLADVDPDLAARDAVLQIAVIVTTSTPRIASRRAMRSSR